MTVERIRRSNDRILRKQILERLQSLDTRITDLETTETALNGTAWVIQNTSATLELGKRYVASNHTGITYTLPTVSGVGTWPNDIWVANSDAIGTDVITVAPPSGGQIYINGATLGVDATQAVADGEAAFLVPIGTDTYTMVIL